MINSAWRYRSLHPLPCQGERTWPLPPDGAQTGKQIVNLLRFVRRERGLSETDLAVEIGQGTHEGGRVPPFARHLSREFQGGGSRGLPQPACFQDPQHPAVELAGGHLPGSAWIELLLPASSPAQDHG